MRGSLRWGHHSSLHRGDLNERLREQAEGDGRREGFVAVAEDGGDAGQCGKFLRRALGVAAGDDDVGRRVATVDAADVGAGSAIGLGGDGAGVDEDDVGAGRQRIGLAGGGERGADGFRIGAGGAAAEIFNVKGHRAAPRGGGRVASWAEGPVPFRVKLCGGSVKEGQTGRTGARLDARAAQAHGRASMNGGQREAGLSNWNWGTLTLYLISIGALALCLWIVLPFLNGMTWAVVLAIVTQPLYRWILARLRNAALASTVTLIVVSLIIVVPSLMVMLSAGNHILLLLKSVQSASAEQSVRQFVASHAILRDSLKYVMNNVDVDAALQKTAGAVAGQLGSVLGKSIHALTQIIVMLFLLFFLYRDKDAALGAARRMIPLKAEETQVLLTRVESAVKALVLGRFLVAALQGLLAGIAYGLLGVGAATLLGALTMLFAMIPAVGAFVVWLPVVAYLFAIHHWVEALILLGFGALVISLLDNILYPILVGTRLQLHSGPVFLAMLGGVVLFGVTGLILGPIVFNMTEALLEIWRERSKTAESQATT